jgi:hypothetical protein
VRYILGLILLTCLGCVVNKQTIKVQASAPAASPADSTVSASYELDWR